MDSIINHQSNQIKSSTSISNTKQNEDTLNNQSNKNIFFELDSRFECSICLEYLKDAVLTSCGHKFCYNCINSWINIKNKNYCPIDEIILDSNNIFIDNYTRREILENNIKCPYKHCNKQINIPEYENHINQCKYKYTNGEEANKQLNENINHITNEIENININQRLVKHLDITDSRKNENIRDHTVKQSNINNFTDAIENINEQHKVNENNIKDTKNNKNLKLTIFPLEDTMQMNKYKQYGGVEQQDEQEEILFYCKFNQVGCKEIFKSKNLLEKHYEIKTVYHLDLLLNQYCLEQSEDNQMKYEQIKYQFNEGNNSRHVPNEPRNVSNVNADSHVQNGYLLKEYVRPNNSYDRYLVRQKESEVFDGNVSDRYVEVNRNKFGNNFALRGGFNQSISYGEPYEPNVNYKPAHSSKSSISSSRNSSFEKDITPPFERNRKEIELYLMKNKEQESQLWEANKQQQTPEDVNKNLLKLLYERIVLLEQTKLEMEIKINKLEKHVEEFHNYEESLQLKLCNGIYFWRIDNFLNKLKEMKETNKYLYSPCFYSSLNGYRFCTRLNISREDPGYLSLFIHIVQGDNDHLLTWPFLGKILFKVMGKCSDKCVEDEIQSNCNLDSFKRAVNYFLNKKAFGFNNFIKISDIINPSNGLLFDNTEFVLRTQIMEGIN